MIRAMALICWMVVFHSAALHAAARDVTVQDDYLDPRELGAEMDFEKLLTPGDSFHLVDVSAGYVHEYQDRGAFTGEDISFVTVADHRHIGDRQYNFEVTYYDQSSDSTRYDKVPRYRTRYQLGKYLPGESTTSPGEVLVSRWQIGLDYERSSAGFGIYGISGEVDVGIPLTPLIGNLSFAYRQNKDPDLSSDTEFIGEWLYRGDLMSFSNGGRLNLTAGIGVDRKDRHTRLLPFRASLMWEFPLFDRISVQMRFSPAYRTSSDSRPSAWNHEFAITLSAPGYVSLKPAE